MIAWLAALVPVLTPVQENPQQKAYRDFALLVEESVAALEPGVLDGAMDYVAFMERVRNGARVPQQFHEAFTQAMRDNLKLGEEVCTAIREDGSYRFMGLHRKGQMTVARFRLLSEGALNYHDLYLARGRSGEGVRILDCFVYLSGEELSASVRRNYAQIAAAEDRGLLASFFGDQPAFVKHVDELIRMQEAMDQGNHREALSVYERLPEDLRYDKNIFLMRIQAAQNVDDQTYERALREFQRYFPREAHLDLILLDIHYIDGEFDEVLACIDRLDRNVGGDPYLDALRGSVLCDSGRIDEGLASLERSIERDPTLEDAYWILLVQAVANERYALAVDLLTSLEDDFGYWFENLEQEQGFERLADSEEYAAWVEAHE